MQLIVVPNDIKDIDIYLNSGINTFIVGLDNYAVNYPTTSLESISKLSKKCSLFVAVNKNIFNNELEDIKNKLISLSKIGIKGVLFYDLGILNIVKENKIDVDLVWHQTHMVTNYNTCNYYYEKGVKYGFVANEITLDEILEINDKTNMDLMVEVFGYPIMSHSRRSLLSNYLKSIGEYKEDRTYHLNEKDEEYLINEKNVGTSILYGRLTNGVRALFDLVKNDVSYGVLDMQEVDNSLGLKIVEEFLYVVNNYNEITDIRKQAIISHIDSLIGSNTNFFYKKTIFKVRKDDNNEKED